MDNELVKTTPKPFVFVLMPFDPAFNDIYKYGIKGAADDAGAYAERIDEQIFVEDMLERIYNQINKADVVVADMTGRNANVFYEVGYAHALGKIVLLLTKNADDIPFDLKHHPHTIYGGSIDRLRNELSKRIAWAIDRSREASESHIGENLTITIDEIEIRDVLSVSEISTIPYSLSLDDMNEERPGLYKSEDHPYMTYSFNLALHVRNTGTKYISSISPTYLFVEKDSLLVPCEARSVSSKLRWDSNERNSYDKLHSITASCDDSHDGLTQQFFLNEIIYGVAVRAVEKMEIPFLFDLQSTKRDMHVRLRLHTGQKFYDYAFLLRLEFHRPYPA